MQKIKKLATLTFFLLIPSAALGESFTEALRRSTDEIKIVVEEEMKKIHSAQQQAISEAAKRMEDHEEGDKIMVGTVAKLEEDYQKKKLPRRSGGHGGVELVTTP